MSAAFSAIIIVGALVFPEVIFGIIEASTTLKFCKPRTRNLLSTTEFHHFPFYRCLRDEKLSEHNYLFTHDLLSSIIMSAAFSAIIIVGALVFPDVM